MDFILPCLAKENDTKVSPVVIIWGSGGEPNKKKPVNYKV
jgi:hypothetical protein